MGITGVQRYRDLVEAVVDGVFYKGAGIILPYKSISTQLRFETDSASTLFGTWLNETFVGEVMSDSEGNVVFDQLLPLGEIVVTIENNTSGNKFVTYITVRDWALWLSAYAETLEEIDSNIQEVQDDGSIETSTINGIEDHFGKAIDVYNNTGQSLDSYRWMVHELRDAYRSTGARYNGVEVGVGAFTQVLPFGYTRRYWGPNWYLDQSMLVNHLYDQRSHSVYDAGAPVNITGVTLVKVEADVSSNPINHQLDYNSAANTLLWSPEAIPGTAVSANDGALFLPGPNHLRAAFVLGRDLSINPYVISVNNDTLYFNVDSLGSFSVTLVTGLPSPTPAQVAGDINTVIAADTRYGGAYATFASVYNSKLFLESVTALDSSIIIEHGATNGAAEIFGNDPGDLVFDPYPFDGVEIMDMSGIFNLLGTGYSIRHEYTAGSPPTRRLSWKPNFALPWGSWVSVTENGTYQLPHGVSSTVMEVYCFFDEMPTSSSTVLFSVGFQKLEENIAQTQGLWVVVDKDSLPVANQTDLIKVYDDEDDGFKETPDNWSIVSPTGFEMSWNDVSDIINGKKEELDPSPAFQWRITDATTTTIKVVGRVHKYSQTWPGAHGGNYPQRSPGLLYDYEGFTAEFSVWLRNWTSAVTTATLSFSFDNMGTWVSGAATPIVSDTGGFGYEDPTLVSISTVIPASVTANGVYVGIQIDVVAGTINASIDSPSVGVKYISSRFLENATVSRWRHNQYFGELLWSWCPDELTLTEKQYIGLQHKIADKTTAYTGVVITNISLDTSAGVGSLDYEYNSVPDTRRLRWSSSESAWGVGLGWIPVVSSGSYDLDAPDGSLITVEVSYDVLSILSGTPPAQSTSKAITITDDTTTQGTVRKIAAAQSAIEIFDTTEYVSTVATNLRGCIREGDFVMSGATNLYLSIADPFRYAYLYPSLGPQSGESVSFSGAAPHLATLDYESDQNQTDAVLYEDGVPVSNDSWLFNSSTQIRVYDSTELPTAISPYNSSATYTIDYGLLYQFTTPYIDLGGNYQNYAWFADYYLWDRTDSVEGAYSTTTPVSFNSYNGRAYLTQKSTQDSSVSKLFVQDGTEYKEIPKRYWRFRDSKTVELDVAYIISGAQYYLEHEEARVYETSGLIIVFEHRSGANSSACLGAAWSEIERNENAYVHSGHQVHQLRLTVSSVRSVKDFKIRSLVLKGMHIHGVSPDVNGLTNIWGT